MKTQKNHRYKRISLIGMLLIGLSSGSWAAEFHLTNGDKVSGEPVAYDGQTYRVKSEYGVLSIPAERVLTILFNPKGGTVLITETAKPGQDSITGKIEYLQDGKWKIVTAYGYMIVENFTQIKQINTAQAAAKTRQLRSEPGTFSADDIKRMVQEKGFRSAQWNPDGNFPNEYEAQTLHGNKVVIDHASGLMWQQSVSFVIMLREDAQGYIDQLNRDRYAGFSDWRLPTIEELASLLEPVQKDNLYIDPVFEVKQIYSCWSSDKEIASARWAVNFSNGIIYAYADSNYVRGVRSNQ